MSAAAIRDALAHLSLTGANDLRHYAALAALDELEAELFGNRSLLRQFCDYHQAGGFEQGWPSVKTLVDETRAVLSGGSE